MHSEPRGSLKSKKRVTLPNVDEEAILKSGKRKSRPSDFLSASQSRYDDATLFDETYSGRTRHERMRPLASSGHVGNGKNKVPKGPNMISGDRNQTNIKSSGTQHGHGTSSVHARHVVETSVRKASGLKYDKMHSGGVGLERMRLLQKEAQAASGHGGKGNTYVPHGRKDKMSHARNLINERPSGAKHGHGSSSLHPLKSTPHRLNAVGISVGENSKASVSRWSRKDHLSFSHGERLLPTVADSPANSLHGNTRSPVSRWSRKDRLSFSHGERLLPTVADSPANSLDGNTRSPAICRPVGADSLDEFSSSSGTDTHWPANSLDENSKSSASDTNWPANSLDENTSSGLSGSSQEHDSASPKVTTLRQWVHGLETSVDQDPRSEGKKSTSQSRGISTGAKWEREVRMYGKYKISFLPGETVAAENNTDLSNAIGVIVKAGAELQGVSKWKEVSESNKKCCYARLSRWFDIEDWSTERVYRIIDKKFQSAYTRWRSALNKIYNELLDEGINPRDVCPRKDLDMIRWHAACDFIEDEKFQKRSQTNKQNRKKMRFTHTTGRIPILCRYKNMKEKNKIELFRITRTGKDGEFVNPLAQSTYEDMIKMQQQAEEAGDAISEDAIMRSALGVRHGYVKGMGHGVEVNPGSENYCSDSISKMVELNLSEVINTKEKVINLETMINNLQVQMTRMEKCVRQIAGIPSYKSQDLAVDDTEDEDDHAENDQADDSEN